MEPVFYRSKRPELLPDNLENDLVVIMTPPDGNCLFHSVLNALWKPYREAVDTKERRLMALQFRDRLADYLDARDFETGKTVYESLMGGNLAVFARESGLPELGLDAMKASLHSGRSVTYEMVELISRYLDYNIYILWLTAIGENREILEPYNVGSSMEPFWYREGRSSIVVLYTPPPAAKGRDMCPGHYETVARMRTLNEGRTHYQTVFSWSDPLIAELAQSAAERLKETKALESDIPRVFLGKTEIREGDQVRLPEPGSLREPVPARSAEDSAAAGGESLMRVALAPGRLLETLLVLREGEVTHLSINIQEAHLSSGVVLVPYPPELEPGQYVVEICDQDGIELLVPSEKEIQDGWIDSLIELCSLVGKVEFTLLPREP